MYVIAKMQNLYHSFRHQKTNSEVESVPVTVSKDPVLNGRALGSKLSGTGSWTGILCGSSIVAAPYVIPNCGISACCKLTVQDILTALFSTNSFSM